MHRNGLGQLRREALAFTFALLVAACTSTSTPRLSEPTVSTPTTKPASQPSLETLPESPSTTVNAGFPAWATSTIVEVDPITLAATGPEIPAGPWSEASAVTDDLIAVATWPREESQRVDARWRLVVASRETGELLFDKRVGDMNVLGMFPTTTGELMIVEPIRSADGNSADGFVVHAYDPGANEVREAARFVHGDFYPSSLTLLSNGHLGVVGTESARQLRIVVFDWQSNQTLTDVTLDDVPLEADAPDGVFVDNMGHPVIWDQPRGRVLVVHAHEDVITTVGVPDGEIEQVPLVEDRSLFRALLAWAVPAAKAKGLPSVQRHAIVSGDHLYVAGRQSPSNRRKRTPTHTRSQRPSC